MPEGNQEQIEEKTYKIEMHELYSGFKSHLDISGNNKVFFSGKYGTGKTTFLKDFFEHHSDAYDVYHLYPINYQIKSNDDVVDLLKYDILVELLKKYPDALHETEVAGVHDHVLLLREFVKNNFTINGALQTTLNYMEDCLTTAESVVPIKISQLGRPLQDLLKLDKQFQAYKAEYKKGDFAKVEAFLEQQESHEPDGLSFIISKKINKLRGDKQSVLILDDLDRMDPEHIFRILNVFSAFHEQDEGGNKFGFDRVVVVGDIDNIRHIFEHFYGPKTDFEGYIDKFYSYEIYPYSHHEIVASAIKQIIKEFGTDDEGGQLLTGFENGYFLSQHLTHLFVELSFTNHYNLRQLLKLLKNKHQVLTDGRYIQPTPFDSQEEFALKSVCFALRVLERIVGKQNVIRALESFRDRPVVGDERQRSERFFSHLNEIILPTVHGTQALATNTMMGQYGIAYKDGVIEYSEPFSELSRKLYFQLLIELMEQNLYAQ